MKLELKHLNINYIKHFLDTNKSLETKNKWFISLYLRTGKTLISNNQIQAAGIGSPDKINDEFHFRHFRQTKVYTDGVWAWEDDFLYLVRKKKVPLPQDFINHIRKNHYGFSNVFLNIKKLKKSFQNCFVDFNESKNDDGIILITIDCSRSK